MNFRDLEIMSRTIWGEARGEPYNGQVAVGNVIMNRARHPKRWANTVRGVCRQKWQFSCWNKDDPNLPKLLNVTLDDPGFRTAVRAALEAYDTDVVDGADHYFADYIEPPRWASEMDFVRQIGVHKFFKTRS